MRLTDAQILQYSFDKALERASKEEARKIELYQAALRESPDSKEIIEMCASVYTEIHHLLIGSTAAWNQYQREQGGLCGK